MRASGAAGDPLPEPTFTLYRGGAGRADRHDESGGFSWTASRERAQWFADRFPILHDPAVYTVTVGEESILAYVIIVETSGAAQISAPFGWKPLKSITRCITRPFYRLRLTCLFSIVSAEGIEPST